MTDALKIGQAYVKASAELRFNTDQLSDLLKNGKVDSPEFVELWQQRDEAYTAWNNASMLLRELPVEGMAVVVNEINRMQTNMVCI
ncbi:hypothetical protein [Paenibacillus sp. FSL R5-808]|jgi:hypothetical protein|uniref:hypothetical protein n=1 Tax=unclassified Paenibacillus TaxID=185978 RepID=UPI0003E2C7B4|nr:hypothetical protein [Paenibacillus sp. FSL R5-808]ETT32163.1 hypothetical protein C169_24175 [Paenibacillus sp. FSL R5-808]